MQFIKKIWEYISVKGNYVLSIKQIIMAATVAIGLFHIFLLVFFAFYNIYPMVGVNIISVLLYLVGFMMIRKGRSLLAIFNIFYFEIVIHSIIATIMMGTDSGFLLYLVATIPLGYYATYNFGSKKKYVNPMAYIISGCLAFCFTRIVCNNMEPLYTYGSKHVDKIIYMINYFVAVIAIVAFFSTLINQIKILEDWRIKQNKKLELLATIDPLTGLVNRRSIEERYSQAELLNEAYAVILGDIDDFKKVNDTYGHDVGDKVLKAIADIFKGNVRDNDVVCRWGGEEILVFLPKCFKSDAVSVAQSILNEVRKLEVDAGNGVKFKVTMTLGVSISSETSVFDAVMKKADERLYDGKKRGKNRVVSG